MKADTFDMLGAIGLIAFLGGAFGLLLGLDKLIDGIGLGSGVVLVLWWASIQFGKKKEGIKL